VEYGDLIGPQQEKLQQYHDRASPIVSWIRGSALGLQVGDITGAFISNELFDAFPVEIVTLSGGRVMQMFVEDSEGTLQPTWRRASLDVNRYIRKFGVRLQEGVEEPINLNAIRLQRTLCASLKRGVILTIDYGESGEVGEIDHPAVRVYGEDLGMLSQPDRRQRAYIRPGELDVTTSVNFAPLLRIAKESGLRVVYSGPQGGFLRGCGILSFSGGDEDGMPASDSRLISVLGMGMHHVQFLAKGIPNLKMRCPTRRAVRSAVALSG
jgi:SAM-dependent MidA family methyltransferase